MSRGIKLGVAGAVFLAQLAVPAAMIAGHELTLSQGTPYKFRTGMVDPVDVFRGRYVRISFRDTEAPLPEGVSPEYGQYVYALLDEDEEGFAVFTGVQHEPPAEGDYLRLRTWSISRAERTVRLNIPFNRYYMRETLAPEAERVYWEHSIGEEASAYAVVRVRNGQGVIEGLFIEDTRIEDYVRQQLATGL
jgi:uncharacterized membrane-anchored protein